MTNVGVLFNYSDEYASTMPDDACSVGLINRVGIGAVTSASTMHVRYDIESTKKNIEKRFSKIQPTIKKVVFNNPATIVFWSDGEKTVVKKGEGDVFDPEKGLAMAIAKRALGNQGSYFNEFKKWIK